MTVVHSDPFAVFRPFAGRLRIAMIAKDTTDDAAAAGSVGALDSVSLWQVHGNRTIVAREPVARDVQADGAATDRTGLALITRWADCQNFVIYAPEQHVLGVLHAGWKGLIAGAIEEHFALLRREWGIEPRDVYVGAGPSLCQQCAEFTDPSTELPTLDSQFIHGRHADLRGAADAILLDLGVEAARFERHPDCTRCHPNRYWTYRGGHREEVQAGHSNMLVAVLR